MSTRDRASRRLQGARQRLVQAEHDAFMATFAVDAECREADTSCRELLAPLLERLQRVAGELKDLLPAIDQARKSLDSESHT